MRSMKEAVMNTEVVAPETSAPETPENTDKSDPKRRLLEECSDITNAGTGSWLAWTCPL